MLFEAKNFYPSMAGKKIDVIGFGVSNTELVFRLAKAGAAVTLHDRRTEEQIRPEQVARLREVKVELDLGEAYLEHLNGEIIFRTPGISYYHPALQAAKAAGKVVTSELEVFMELCPCPVFAITGSDGKTTTSSILAEILRKTGKTVHLGGNIGKPLLSVLDFVKEEDFAVIELSSFQLLSMRVSPDVAVLTNIAPNHLDVHKDMEEYITAKRNVLLHQSAFGRAVLSKDNAIVAGLTDDVRGTLRWFSRREKVADGAWMDENGDLFHSIGGRTVPLMNRKEMKLRGIHNVENFLAAAGAAWGYATPRMICEVGREFGGVEHRIEFVRKLDGVRWYNDSIATSPTRTIAGLLSFEEKLIVIAGGYDKKLPFEPLVKPMLDRAKLLILTGATADRMEETIRSSPDFAASELEILRVEDMQAAVLAARARAKDGDVVTLSPACASFDAFPNFEARGRAYKDMVHALV